MTIELKETLGIAQLNPPLRETIVSQTFTWIVTGFMCGLFQAHQPLLHMRPLQ